MGSGLTGAGLIGTTSFILIILVKILFALFVIGLIVGLVLTIKNHIFTKDDLEALKTSLTGKKEIAAKQTCNECGKEIDEQWKVCPFCGKGIVEEVA